MIPPLRDAARGRWHGILPNLGLTSTLLSGKHGPCPICSEGRDRFRFDDRDGRGTWICSVCGAGDGISLVMLTKKVDFKGATALIEPLIDTAAVHKKPSQLSEAEKRDWMNRLWNDASSIASSDPTGTYLSARLGLSHYPSVLRCHLQVPHVGGATRGPAMLAKVVDRDGKPINIHRTYLTPDGKKADTSAPRAVMSGNLPEGCAVRLQAPTDTLGVAEGIETALAASRLHKVPCWAALNASLLSKWTPPPGVTSVVVFGDNDANFTGQHAAFQLANRLAKLKISIRVELPAQIGADWADVLQQDSSSLLAA